MQKLTKEQSIILTGFTGVLCGNLADFRADVEKRLGRPIFSSELANACVQAEIKAAYREDFIALCAGEV